MPIERPLIVLQPTSFCNIDCSYCYLPQRAAKRRMSLEVIRRIASQVFSLPWWSDEITFLWHLGEPLSVPLAFYEQAFAEIAAQAVWHERRYVHSIQTNATLVDESWCSFLREHRVQVGVSLDGPAFIHDRCRRRRDGRGTHELTMRGVHALQRSGIHFGVIAVLTDFSLDHADEMFAFFHEQGVARLAFNIDEIEGVHRETSFASARARERYRHFLERFLGALAAQGAPFELRELRNHLPPILHGAPPYNMGSQPLRIVTFDCEGNFSSFCPELVAAKSERFNDFVMGNILTDNLEQLPSSPVYQRVRAEIELGLKRCEAKCAYWRFCGGGDPSSKFFEHGRFDVTETTTCRVHKMVSVDAVLKHLEDKHLRVGKGAL